MKIISVISLSIIIALAASETDSDGEYEENPSEALQELRKQLLTKRPKPVILSVSPAEMQKLCQYIGVEAIDPARSDYLLVMVEKLTCDHIKKMPDDMRLIAGKIAIQFLDYNYEDWEIYDMYYETPVCQSYSENVKGQAIWSLTSKHTRKLEKKIHVFHNAYKSWYHGLDNYFKYQEFGGQIDQDRMPALLQYMEKYKEKLMGSIADLDTQLEFVFKEISNVPCNIKNLMAYYQQLPRFYDVYLKAPKGFTRKRRFLELGNLLGKSRIQFNEYFYTVDSIRFLRDFVNEFYFYLDREQDPIITAKFMNIVIQNTTFFSYVFVTQDQVNFRNEKIYKELKFIIYSLEDAAGIKPKPFPRLKFGVAAAFAAKMLAVFVSALLALIIA